MSEKESKAELAEKAKNLDAALLQIEKQYGKGSVMKLGDAPIKDVEVYETGILQLDRALGIGGVPKGRIIEIYGPESAGKTSVTLSIVAEVQKQGGIAAFIDAEHALDPQHARTIGVNTDELLVSQPDNGEQALEIAEALVRSGGVQIVVVDSVAALVPKSEIEGDMGQAQMGVQARLMSQALRKLTGAVYTSNCVLIFINQIRMKIGVMFGNPETTTGGNALKFYASVRMDIRRVESITKGDDVIGNQVRVKIVKNKMAPPFKKAEFELMFSNGFDREGQIVDVGSELGVLTKSGTWFSFKDNRLGQGKENVKAYLRENPKLRDELLVLVKQAIVDAKSATSDKKKADEPPVKATKGKPTTEEVA
jgi:recombination protein RecA